MTLLLTSCSNPSPDVKVTQEDIEALKGDPAERIPLRAGFYMGPIFKNMFARLQLNDWVENKFLPDAEINSMFHEAAGKMFDEIVPLSGTETSEDYRSKKLDVVLVVGRISVSDNTQEGFRAFGGRLFKTRVFGKWEVSSVDGRRIYFTDVTGEGEAKMGFTNSEKPKQNKKAFVAAFDDHFKRAYKDVVGSGWWKDSSWKSK